MRRLLSAVVVVLTAALAAALTARTGVATNAPQFRTPDAAAACRLEGAALHCSSLATSATVVLRGRGAPQVVRELPWWDASTPVLRTWRGRGVGCRLAGEAILCRNGDTAIRAAADGFAVTR